MSQFDQFNSVWRKTATAIYKKPVDSKIFGGVEFDITELEKYISQKRREGLKITTVHFFLLVLARALKTEIPELNTYVRRGRIILRPNIDANVSILQADGSMSSIIVPKADEHNYNSLVAFLNEQILKIRKGDNHGASEKKNFLARLPWPFRNWFFYLYQTVTIKWGLSMPILGLDPNSFGSYLVSSIGSLGLDYGFPALLPSSNLSFVLLLGGIQKKPVVINDEIVIRRMMTVTIVLDHRIVDASHGAKLFKYIKQAMKHPEDYE